MVEGVAHDSTTVGTSLVAGFVNLTDGGSTSAPIGATAMLSAARSPLLSCARQEASTLIKFCCKFDLSSAEVGITPAQLSLNIDIINEGCCVV